MRLSYRGREELGTLWRSLRVGLVVAAVIMLIVLAWLFWPKGAEKQAPTGAMNVPPFNQGDYTKTVAVIGGQDKSVKTSGCGAACVASLGQYLTGDTEYDPQSLFQWAYDNDYYHGDGLSHAALSKMAGLFKLKTQWTDDQKDVLDSLRDKRPVVAHMGHGAFSSGTGHYIMLVGQNSKGQIIIHDPGSRKRSGSAYDLDFLVGQAKGETPFMIVY